MAKHFKRAVSVLLSVLLLAGILTAAPLTANAEEEPYSQTGFCGYPSTTDIQWFAFEDKSLVFLGTGDMQDYSVVNNISTAPWLSDDMTVVGDTIFSTKIVVESGITSIGNYAFYLSRFYEGYVASFKTIGAIDLSDTVTSIGKYAFYNQVLENANIPPSVTYIGTQAFMNCKNLKQINYYGNPAELSWEHTAGVDEFNSTSYSGSEYKMVCHILNTYTEKQVAEFNTKFASIKLNFVNDLVNPYESDDGYTRNIALYYGATNSNIFAGAYPYIIVGTFDGKKKSTTYGSNGFISCVRIPNGNGGYDYYLLSDSNGTLKKVNIDSSGRASSLGDTYEGLKLELKHEYIGSNVVKVKYKLINNTGKTLNNIQLGGSGDIKIGADDRADIKTLKNADNNDVGFYMSSGQQYDLSASGEYATLGFIGSNIRRDQDESEPYPSATWFYGTVGGSSAFTAAGTRGSVAFPQRIFEANTGSSGGVYDSITNNSTYSLGRDSGMSFYWNIASLENDQTIENAVLFSIYGNDSDGEEMVNDITAKYHTVIFKNGDTELQKILVKEGTTKKPVYPVYTGDTPKKNSDANYKYTFSGWSPEITAVTSSSADTITYSAQFSETERPFFTGYSLTLGGDIGVNFFVDPTTIPELSINGDKSLSKTVKLKFNWFNKESSYTINSSDYDPDSGYYKIPCKVAAAEMMYSITAKVYVDNSSTPLTEDRFTDEYKVRDYADVVLNSNSDFSRALNEKNAHEYHKLVELTQAMLDYGAKAQAVFGRMTDQLANKDVDYTMVEKLIEVDSPGNFNAASGGQTLKEKYGIEFRGATLVFNTTTDIRLYYKVANQEKFDSTLGSMSDNHLVKNEDFLCYDIRNIPAYELDEEQTVTIGDDTYEISALQVARLMQAVYPEADSNEHKLATSLFWYNHYANEYFGYKGA